jgi:Flp pilus assembly secretin CpaC
MMPRVYGLFASVKRLTTTALFLLTASALVAAQDRARPASSTPQNAADSFPKVQLIAGRSTVIGTEFDVTRIAITNPEVADAVVVQAREILIDGKKPGTVKPDRVGIGFAQQYNIIVEQPTTSLEQQLHMLFPGET